MSRLAARLEKLENQSAPMRDPIDIIVRLIVSADGGWDPQVAESGHGADNRSLRRDAGESITDFEERAIAAFRQPDTVSVVRMRMSSAGG